jgi:amino acid transporter
MNAPGFIAPEAEPPNAPSTAVDFGLRRNVLSPLEVLAQSIATISPSSIPVFAVPLVYALAGNGAWLAFVIAMGAMLLVALCIAVFARDSSSPGSLYVYIRDTLPPAFSAVVAWALLFAYVATASSGMGAIMSFVVRWKLPLSPTLVPALLAIGAVAVVYREVKFSAELMLWIEVLSVSLILIVVAITLWKRGLHIDPAQLHLTGATVSGVRLGVILAIFGFVGFESATALGCEAKDPLHNIPRAVLRSAIVAGFFFIVCCYTETASFHSSTASLGDSASPMQFLAAQASVPFFAILIDAGVFISLFSGIIAFIIASARILLLMAHHGHLPRHMAKTHARNDTPVFAALWVVLAMTIPVTVFALRGANGAELYNWMANISVFGYLTAYGLVAIAMPIHLYQRARLGFGTVLLSVIATMVTFAALAGTVYPVPPAPYRYLPWIYMAYLVVGMTGYTVARFKTSPAS